MEINIAALISLLTPLLLKVGEKVCDGVIEQVGSDVWNRAKQVWYKLRPKIEADPDAQKAVQYFVNQPDAQMSQDFLSAQLKKILENDKVLAKEIALLIETDSDAAQKGFKSNKTQIGNKNIAIDRAGGDVIIEIS